MRRCMIATIDFDDKFCRRAIKVGNPAEHNSLPIEFEADAPRAQPLPQRIFGGCWCFAHSFCVRKRPFFCSFAIAHFTKASATKRAAIAVFSFLALRSDDWSHWRCFHCAFDNLFEEEIQAAVFLAIQTPLPQMIWQRLLAVCGSYSKRLVFFG